MQKARLHPIWVGGRDGYRYSVLFDGKLLVERSRDPECDAARVLLAKGMTGQFALLSAIERFGPLDGLPKSDRQAAQIPVCGKRLTFATGY